MTGPNSSFPSARIIRSAGANRSLLADWVLVGWRERGLCYLLASESVDDAHLSFAHRRQQWQFMNADDLRRAGIKMARHIEADILNYELIEAETFAECLAALLFGVQWKPDTIKAIGTAGMGRAAGPSVQTDPTPPCGAPAFEGSVMHCDQPAGHYPETDHAHTVTWQDTDTGGDQPAITERPT